MKKPSRTLARIWLVSGYFIVLLLSGCWLIHPAPAFELLEGTWTGTLQRVEGYDGRHEQYWLTVLEIDSGPHWPSKDISPSGLPNRLPQQLKSDRSAVLTHLDAPSYFRIDPDNMPIGHRVRVRGTMTIGSVFDNTRNFATIVRKIPGYEGPVPSHELVIVLDGEPDVID